MKVKSRCNRCKKVIVDEVDSLSRVKKYCSQCQKEMNRESSRRYYQKLDEMVVEG